MLGNVATDDVCGDVADLKLLKEKGIVFPTSGRKRLPAARDKSHFSLIA